jgi:hypothetical protein
VTWAVPAEMSPTGNEVWISRPGDQGVFEGIDLGAVYIRRSDDTLNNFSLDAIRDVEVLDN